jgi:hypothetical protein
LVGREIGVVNKIFLENIPALSLPLWKSVGRKVIFWFVL